MTMTDDELARLWQSGTTLRELCQLTRRTKDSLQKYLSRKRDKEGTARWPRRQNPVNAPKAKPAQPHIKRAGSSTLPPLDSLR